LTDYQPGEQGVPEDVNVDGTVAADLMPRFLARLIDGMILWLVFVVIIVPIVVVAAFGVVSRPDGWQDAHETQDTGPRR